MNESEGMSIHQSYHYQSLSSVKYRGYPKHSFVDDPITVVSVVSFGRFFIVRVESTLSVLNRNVFNPI